MVCNITKKFEMAKYFTQINYAQGLFIWIFNKAWFNSLPLDLQKTFKEVVHEVCAKDPRGDQTAGNRSKSPTPRRKRR